MGRHTWDQCRLVVCASPQVKVAPKAAAAKAVAKKEESSEEEDSDEEESEEEAKVCNFLLPVFLEKVC